MTFPPCPGFNGLLWPNMAGFMAETIKRHALLTGILNSYVRADMVELVDTLS